MTNKWIVIKLKSFKIKDVEGRGYTLAWELEGYYGPYGEYTIDKLQRMLVGDDNFSYEFYCLKDFDYVLFPIK